MPWSKYKNGCYFLEKFDLNLSLLSYKTKNSIQPHRFIHKDATSKKPQDLERAFGAAYERLGASH